MQRNFCELSFYSYQEPFRCLFPLYCPCSVWQNAAFLSLSWLRLSVTPGKRLLTLATTSTLLFTLFTESSL
jgi:hypothetical protein